MTWGRVRGSTLQNPLGFLTDTLLTLAMNRVQGGDHTKRSLQKEDLGEQGQWELKGLKGS